MLIKIDGVLSTAAVQHIRGLLAKSKFEDGRTTAGVAVRDVKKNLPVNAIDEGSNEARQIVAEALVANHVFNPRALLRREMLMELMEAARWARSVAPGSLEAMKLSKDLGRILCICGRRYNPTASLPRYFVHGHIQSTALPQQR